jgi:hypothetical protein
MPRDRGAFVFRVRMRTATVIVVNVNNMPPKRWGAQSGASPGGTNGADCREVFCDMMIMRIIFVKSNVEYLGKQFHREFAHRGFVITDGYVTVR